MSGSRLQTPVVIVIFQRLDTTSQVLARIREARPRTLLVAADGPRPHIPGEAARCAAVRELFDRVDWDCEVLTSYSEENLGCDQRLATGIKWAFEQVEEAIILEDDALPHPTFFPFCQELLERYRHDTRIMAISGTNFVAGQVQEPQKYSYYFGPGGGFPGWATWRRAYNLYDYDMKLWPEIRDDQWLGNIFDRRDVQNYIFRAFEEAGSGRILAWSYRWAFACMVQSGMGIYPFVNLVSNLGFRSDATQTFNSRDFLANLPLNPMEFPLRHPPFVIRDKRMENLVFRRLQQKPPGKLGRLWPWPRGG
ncbi:MAG: glycosyltransferase family 2 protein [Deltaproteobacteria bacterium]|nr:glycosyltransferase family 2 protein [Deltaproteobacteria bacterium]